MINKDWFIKELKKGLDVKYLDDKIRWDKFKFHTERIIEKFNRINK